MPNKSFSIYHTGDNLTVETNDQLFIEIGNSHIACILSKKHGDGIVAIEFFTFNDHESLSVEELFASVSEDSKLLGKTTTATHVYINNEYCIPVPVSKFNKDIASDYLNIVFGENDSVKVHFEYLATENGIMNVYRVSDDWLKVLNERFSKVVLHHTYTNAIRKLPEADTEISTELIAIQFYNACFIVVVMKGGKLLLIQSFTYESAEDVLYNLLNITQRFELFSRELKVQVSGMIDIDFKLYRELIKYFKNITVSNVDISTMSLNINDHPLHYFTPFFNLVI